jgi:hypothetical protein
MTENAAYSVSVLNGILVGSFVELGLDGVSCFVSYYTSQLRSGLYTALVILTIIIARKQISSRDLWNNPPFSGKCEKLTVFDKYVIWAVILLYSMAIVALGIWVARIRYAFTFNNTGGSDGVLFAFYFMFDHSALVIARDVMAIAMSFVADCILVSLRCAYLPDWTDGHCSCFLHTDMEGLRHLEVKLEDCPYANRPDLSFIG